MRKERLVLIHIGNFCDSKPAEKDLSPPYGIIYLGSYLAKCGYRVSLLDVRVEVKESFFTHLKKELQDAVLVGLSVMTPLTKEALEITRWIKNIDPSIRIVWGGFHATLFPESTLRNKLIDFVITGEGEKGALGLAEYLFGKRDIADIPNLLYKASGGIIKNRLEPGEDLGLIGIPAYDRFDFLPYLHQENWFIPPGRRQIDVLTSRGCHARCAFCVNSIILKSRWRAESLEQTLLNLDVLIERYAPKHICFSDEDFFCNLQRINALAPELGKRKLTWDANCRADYIKEGYLDGKMLTMLYETGLRGMRFGLESGSPRVLRLLNKQITVEQSLHAIEELTRHHIGAVTFFMMGIPDETPEDIMLTLGLILKILKVNSKVIVAVFIFRPYPGSCLFNRCVEKGLTVPSHLDEWSSFFMPENTVDNYPWFPEVSVLRKASLWLVYIYKQYLPFWLRYLILRFHVITKCKLISIDYQVFRFFKKIFTRLRGLRLSA